MLDWLAHCELYPKPGLVGVCENLYRNSSLLDREFSLALRSSCLCFGNESVGFGSTELGSRTIPRLVERIGKKQHPIAISVEVFSGEGGCLMVSIPDVFMEPN